MDPVTLLGLCISLGFFSAAGALGGLLIFRFCIEPFMAPASPDEFRARVKYGPAAAKLRGSKKVSWE
jgi:hypothetical protein